MKKSLEEIYLQYGIRIRNERGFLMNPLEILQDIYYKLDKQDFEEIQDQIYNQHKIQDIFDEEKKKGDWTL